MTGGRLIAVVGPSGVGKDSVMAGMAARAPGRGLVRRAITRAPGLGGEDYNPMTPEAFAEAVAAGDFCLHWDAHGLRYGIPARVRTDVRGGADRLVNLSRGALTRAAEVFPRLVVLNITAAPEVLAGRLAGRGRESAEEIARRLARAARPLPAGLETVTLTNDGPIEETVARALAVIAADPRGAGAGHPHTDPPIEKRASDMNTQSPSVRFPGAQAGPAPEPLCLANARLVLRDRVLTGRLTVDEGRIAEIVEGDHVPAGAVDCGGDVVMPGLVELHTDNLERHIEPRPSVDWPHLPAILAHDAELAATGITTVFDAMRVGSIHDGKARYEPYARALASELMGLRAGGHLRISHFLHLRAEICSETLLEEMAAFGPEDRVGIVSLMDHTPGQRQFRDLTALKTYVTKKRGMTDADFVEHVAKLKALRHRFGDRHENGAVAEARRYGAVLASHDDTTAEQVATSRGHGVGFAEFPTTLEAAEACRAEGIAVMMGAPNLIRGGSHSGNVAAQDLAQAGLLDIVSSDYVPSALLLAAFRLFELWDDLPRAVACVTETPARAAGLTDRGRLEAGWRGDILRVGRIGPTPVVRGVWSRGARVA